jgi:3-deoxy-D-arabino-heptulosonate 7-phosphate (DAHP) synthase class II
MESMFHSQILLYPFTYSQSTLTSGTGLKTRNFGTIISELTSCLEIHAACGSRLGGVSLEFTGELNEEGFSVTECLGGSMELSEEQLGLRYQVGGLISRGYMRHLIVCYSRFVIPD